MSTIVKLKSSAPSLAAGRNLIAIASGKGGVGKTWLAITLAHALARSGRKVLLFDGDLGLANIDVQLGMMPERDLCHVVNGTLSLMEAAAPVADAGFDMIGGRSGSGVLARLSPSALEGLRDGLVGLGGRYDFVVLDLGAGVDDCVMTLASHGGAVLVVITEEPTALTDAYALIKLLVMRNPRADIRVVVNMASSGKQGERTFEALNRACRSFLKIQPKLAGVIRRDLKVPETIRHQSPLLTRHPLCPAATDVETLAKALSR